MNNISRLTNYIFTSCTIFNSASTVFIKSFATGESDDVAVTGEDLYPRCFVEQPFIVTYTNNTIEYDLQLIIMDKYLADETDLISKQDLTFEIINHLIEKFKRDRIYILDPNYILVSQTAYNDDITSAWRAELKFLEAIPVNKCLNENVFGNCYDSNQSIDVGFESTSHLMSVTLGEGYFSPDPGTLTFDNLPAIEDYLNSIVNTGQWSVYFDADNFIHFKLSHYQLTPLIIRIYLSGWGTSLGLNFQTTACTLD